MPKNLESNILRTFSPPVIGDSLDQYLNDITKIPLISREREAKLAREYRNPNTSPERQDEIVKKLTKSNLRFVVSTAKKYQGRGVKLADLIEEGNYGLIIAARKYDPDLGVRFISYAVWWVRQRILKYIGENGRLARIPLNTVTKANKVNRIKNKHIEEGMSEHAALQAALKETGLDLDTYLKIEGLKNPTRLDVPQYDNGDSTETLDRFIYEETVPTDENAEKTDLLDILKASLQTLPPREEQILNLYFSLDEENDMTLEKIGNILGVTRERIRQLRDRALERLRKGEYGEALKQLHDAS